MARQPLGGIGRLIFRGFTIALFRHITFGRTPLDEGPTRRRDIYLTTHNNHKRQTSMAPVGFEPTILISERPQTHALDRMATGIGLPHFNFTYLALNYRARTTLLPIQISIFTPLSITFSVESAICNSKIILQFPYLCSTEQQ
jgi:hypothetical protein